MKVSLPTLLFVLFVALKLCHVIAWSWLWVTSPLWIFSIIWVIVVVLAVHSENKKRRSYNEPSYK